MFQSSILSNGLHRLLQPSALSVTPDEIYQEIKKIAEVRFGFQCPKKLNDFAWMDSIHYKTALLRDLCKCIGIQLIDEEKREYLFGNSINCIIAYYNEQQKQDA